MRRANHRGAAWRTRPVPAALGARLAAALAQLDSVSAELQRLGLDWNDVAHAITPRQRGLPLDEPNVVPLQTQTEAPPATPEWRWLKPDELLALIDQIEKRSAPGSIGERTTAFLATMRQLAADYPVVRLSVKQSNWLDGLCEDLGIKVA